MKKVSFYTLGCKLNQAETAILAEQFEHRGYQLKPFGEQVDICVKMRAYSNSSRNVIILAGGRLTIAECESSRFKCASVMRFPMKSASP